MNDAPKHIQIMEWQMMLMSSWSPRSENPESVEELREMMRIREHAWAQIAGLYNWMCKEADVDRTARPAFAPWWKEVVELRRELEENP